MPRFKDQMIKKVPLVKSSSLIDQKSEADAESNKKIKNFERIKELEELIKNEDNIIHQTGIALILQLQMNISNVIEFCLFHVKKRQAYSFEINRLKHTLNTDKSDNNESNDLTGLLIFSDLQLPIKESYVNKLKTGNEKRIFYFLC